MRTSENATTVEGDKVVEGNKTVGNNTGMNNNDNSGTVNQDVAISATVNNDGNTPTRDKRVLDRSGANPRNVSKKPVKKKGKNSKSTIVLMIVVALVILTGYYYITAGKSKPQDTDEVRAINAQAQELLEMDLDRNYPEDPKEVVEIYSKITQSIYSDVDDKYIKELGAKARMLYDEEFLALNPEDEYYNELLTNISTWRDNNRIITKYIVLGEDYSKYSIIEGIEYQTEYVLFTFQEEAKASQYWAFLLRKNEEGQWKIAGWEAVEPSSKS